MGKYNEELPIPIKLNEYELLKDEAVKHGLSLKDYTNQLIIWKFQRDELRQKMFPILERIAYKNGVLYILDKSQKKVAQVSMKNKRLECDVDKSDICDHVLFALLFYDTPLFYSSLF